METKDTPLTKPNRVPDYVSTRGLYFWFDEMIYCYDGQVKAMVLDSESSKLRIREEDQAIHERHRFCMCERCSQNKLCEKLFFTDHIQVAYKDWYIKMTETALLGEPNEKE